MKHTNYDDERVNRNFSFFLLVTIAAFFIGLAFGSILVIIWTI